MPEMTPSKIQSILDEKGVIPSRKLGQNFLADKQAASWIVDQLDLTLEDTVVEVGPGTGALTEHIVDKVGRLILIEYDARLAEYLTARFADDAHVNVIHIDAARFDIGKLYAYPNLKFIGNLPYSAGGAIVKRFLSHPTPINVAVLMFQKEFVDRMKATADMGTKAYGVLSLRMQLDWDIEELKVLPPECFLPEPVIDSTVVRFTPRKDKGELYEGLNRFDFDRLIRVGFAQRRKQLKKQLKNEEIPNWSELMESLGHELTVRAEELSLEQWLKLTRYVSTAHLSIEPQAQKSDEVLDVVNAEDEIIGTATRAEIHEKNLAHRSVHILVFDKYKRVYLQQRSKFKDTHPLAWTSSASGHIDAGESYENAAIRELEEELSLEVESTSLTQIGHLPASGATGSEELRIYAIQYTGQPVWNCYEIEAGRWFDIETVNAWLDSDHGKVDFAGGFAQVWAAFIAKI
mgnify:CR=1 FL=1